MIQIGVIGGGLGARCIIPKFREIEDCEVVAFMSGHYSNTKQLAQKYGIKYPCQTIEEMCSIPLDLICIASPPQFHYEQASKILQKNINVLCEKPFAMTARDTNQLIDCSGVKAKCFIDLELRFNPYFQYIKHNISKIGKIYNIKMSFESDLFLNEWIKTSWLYNEQKGGGIRLSIMPHFLDLLLYWLDFNCISLKGYMMSPISNNGTSEFCQVQMLLEDKILVELSASAIVRGPKFLEIKLLGERGILSFDLLNGLNLNHQSIDIALPSFYKKEESIFRSSFGCYARKIVSVLKGDEADMQFFTSFDEIKRIHQFVEDIQESATSGSEIKYYK